MAPKLPEQTCACGCGKTFTPERSNQRFLSREHRVNYHRGLARQATQTRQRVCPHCGRGI